MDGDPKAVDAPTTLAKVVAALFALKVALNALIALPVGAYSLITYSTLPPGTDPHEELFLCDFLSLGVGVAQTLSSLLVAVLFLILIYRFNKALRVYFAKEMEFTPGWSVGWFFIPIANLFKPYQAVREMWLVARRGRSGTALLKSWWALWLVSAALSQISTKLAIKARTIPQYIASDTVSLLLDCLDIAYYVVVAFLVAKLASSVASAIAEAQEKAAAETPSAESSLDTTTGSSPPSVPEG